LAHVPAGPGFSVTVTPAAYLGKYFLPQLRIVSIDNDLFDPPFAIGSLGGPLRYQVWR
jgi:hypothetical protein